MDVLIHMQLLELELRTFHFWGMKTPFTRAHGDLLEKDQISSWNHMGSLQ